MATQQYVLGIRREDKNRWERRAPVAPEHVKKLVESGVKVLVQPSTLRTYPDSLYKLAGAVIEEDLSSANTIISVKEVPVELLMKDKTYIFFSHTIKAQQGNMPMLDDILRKNIRLIDYELITDEKGKRLVRFGKFAGYAGMIDTLHALGDRLLALGHSTPFLHLGLSYCYSSLDTAKEAVKAMGEEIANFGIPDDLVPMTFTFTSEGNVSQGAQEVFKLLPHKMLTPDEMVHLVKNKHEASKYIVYGTVVKAEDYVELKSESKSETKSKFNKEQYYSHPELYNSVFYEKFADSISVIMNCAYWDYRFPRMITIDQMEELVEQKRSRLIAVGDISCDKRGSLEFLVKTTSIDQPLFIYNPTNGDVYDNSTSHDWMYQPGILFCAVDNFPTEFPKEATIYFGDNLLPFLESIAKSDFSKPYAEQTDLPQEIHKAVIACHGQLTPKYQYIFDLRRENEKTLRSILILGAGYVSGPCIDYLSRNLSNLITIADMYLSQAEALLTGVDKEKRSNCKAVQMNVGDKDMLDQLVSQHNVVICLLPASLHPTIMESCLRCGKNMLTASYITPAMATYHNEAVKQGITFLNEIGLDPGIDHLEARRVIDEVHAKGGKIRSFVSWCGGLPLPENSVNPLGYKFSWSPRGVLTASTRDAKYLQDGKLVEVAGQTLFKNKQSVDIFPGFSLEGIPNRDSTIYAEQYGITDEVRTIFRGTLRYKGFCEIMEAAVDIGLLDETPQPFLQPNSPDITWEKMIRQLLKGSDSDNVEDYSKPEDPSKKKVKTKHMFKRMFRARDGFPFQGYDDDKLRRISNAFTWIGLFSDKIVLKKGNYLDCFCEILQEKLVYDKGEKDMIILHHIFGIEWKDGTRELKTSTLVAHGDKKTTAMANTVGLPIAIATELVLDGVIQTKGVVGPMDPQVFKPVLKALSNEGIIFVEKSSLYKK